jgi:pimeloyl-ACP methyl ester carboxylesterase
VRSARKVCVVACAALLLATAAGCDTGEAQRVEKGTVPSPSAADGTPEGSALAWQECGDAECATLEVPLAANDETLGTIELALARHPARGERTGVLLVNPGGPGADALWMAEQAAQIFPDEILDHFDVVAWDPRGVGRSTSVDCGLDDEAFWALDRSPDTPQEVQDNVAVARQFARTCGTRHARLLPYLSSSRTVDDMEQIREALGEEQISYLGLSYGSYLGTLYADRYPQRVRAMVLDGAVDPSLPAEEAAVQQAAGFERALDAFLADCSADEECDFHAGGDSASAYTRLMAAIDAEPTFARVDGEVRTLGPGEADVGVAQALYAGRDGWPTLASALAAAARGDGSELLAMSDDYTDRRDDGTYSDRTEAFYATSCVDGTAPADVDALRASATAAGERAPNFGATTIWLGLPCVYWPAEPDVAQGPFDARGAPAIVVLGTTNDPATPHAWAVSLADQLDSARLVTLDDEGHTAFLRGNDCIDDTVVDYLVDLEAPPDGTEC